VEKTQKANPGDGIVSAYKTRRTCSCWEIRKHHPVSVCAQAPGFLEETAEFRKQSSNLLSTNELLLKW